MRIGAAISVLFHVALVMAMLLFANADAFTPTPAEAITVDIVPEKEAPEQPKLDIPAFDFTKKDGSKDSQNAESKASETKPADVKLPETKPAEPRQPDQAAAKQKQPERARQAPPDKPAPNQQAQQPQTTTTPPAQSAQQGQPTPTAQAPFEQQIPPQSGPVPYADLSQKFSSLTGADGGQFDAPAAVTADVTRDAIAALRQKIRECSVLPKSVARDDAIEFVLRVSLRPDGTLAAEPDLFKIVKPTIDGAALTVSAKKALLNCQPYTMLPADKYNEWKTLDLGFTTRDFRG